MRPLNFKIRAILLWALILCPLYAIPAHAQIVSYLGSDGKRVFINSDPAPASRQTKPVTAAASINAKPAPNTSPAAPVASPILSASAQANREKIEQMLREVSARYHVDPALIRAVVETESNWNSSAISRKGAQGLMQLVPETAQQLGVKNAFDPQQNLDAGVRYLRTLLERYNGDLDKALAAYNAGPGAVDRAGGVPRFRETQAYVQKVTDSYSRAGSDRRASALDVSPRIYRSVDEGGRVVFTNE